VVILEEDTVASSALAEQQNVFVETRDSPRGGSMTGDQPAAIGQPGFVRGNERLDQLLADPRLAADVAAAHADAEEMD
jgi:hypothetical protein